MNPVMASDRSTTSRVPTGREVASASTARRSSSRDEIRSADSRISGPRPSRASAAPSPLNSSLTAGVSASWPVPARSTNLSSPVRTAASRSRLNLAPPPMAANAGTDAVTSAETSRAVCASTGRSTAATSADRRDQGVLVAAIVSMPHFYHVMIVHGGKMALSSQ